MIFDIRRCRRKNIRISCTCSNSHKIVHTWEHWYHEEACPCKGKLVLFTDMISSLLAHGGAWFVTIRIKHKNVLPYFFKPYELYCLNIWSYVSPLVQGILCKKAPPSKTYCTVSDGPAKFAASEHHVGTSKMDFVVFRILFINRAIGS